MAVDLSGGLDRELEYVWAECPPNPEQREGVNIWAWDEDGSDFGLIRVGVEAVQARYCS